MYFDATQVVAAMCTILGVTLARVPNATLQSKFVGCTKILGGIMASYSDNGPLYKSALGCLCQVVAAMDPANWPAAAGPFALVLRSITDPRPKARKRGQQGLSDILVAIRNTPAIHPASDALLKGTACCGVMWICHIAIWPAG